MKQVDTKKLVLACLVIMVLMILYTKVQTGMEQSRREAEVEAAERPNSLLASGQLLGFAEASEETVEEQETEDEENILGPAEKIDIKKARKEPYGLVVELDYVSAGRISLHGNFGYLAVALNVADDGTVSATIENAVTLEELGGIKMGGAAYTDILGGDGCALIVPGIHNEEIARRRRFLYIEETNEITGGIVAPDWMMQKVSCHDYSDAVTEEALVGEAKQMLDRESKLLYGPVVIPEYDSNVYGILAESGENLEDIWYGIWDRDTGTLVKVPLFD
ncbi:MAG: hypothetical protein E7246_07485 [Lachnoclostridium sp.]|nr:hypothetical protein [Lachnoclostridium sp.]